MTRSVLVLPDHPDDELLDCAAMIARHVAAEDIVQVAILAEGATSRPVPQPQSGDPVLFKRRTPSQSDWSDATNLNKVHDSIRMLDADGYSPAFIDVGGFRLEFTRASRRADAVAADVRIIPLGTIPAKAKT